MRLLRLLYTVPLRLRSLFRRDQVEQDLEDEFRDHLERYVEAGIARGMTRDEARRAAMRAFGGVEQKKEECRDIRRVNFIEHRLQDLLPVSAGLAPTATFWVSGRTNDEQRPDDWPVRQISAHYFTTLQARLVRGRYFSREEVASVRPVIIINESAARRYFPSEEPIGPSIALGGAASLAREIVGVVADIKDGPPETPSHPSAYVPFDQRTHARLAERRRDADVHRFSRALQRGDDEDWSRRLVAESSTDGAVSGLAHTADVARLYRSQPVRRRPRGIPAILDGHGWLQPRRAGQTQALNPGKCENRVFRERAVSGDAPRTLVPPVQSREDTRLTPRRHCGGQSDFRNSTRSAFSLSVSPSENRVSSL